MYIENIKIGKKTFVTSASMEYHPLDTIFVYENEVGETFFEVIEINISTTFGYKAYVLEDVSYEFRVNKMKDPTNLIYASLILADERQVEQAKQEMRFH